MKNKVLEDVSRCPTMMIEVIDMEIEKFVHQQSIITMETDWECDVQSILLLGQPEIGRLLCQSLIDVGV